MSMLSEALGGGGGWLSMGTLGLDSVFNGGSGSLGIPTVPELTGQEAAKDAARDVRDASNASTALQREMWQTSRDDLAPYREAGVNALNTMGGYQMPSMTMDDFYASPDYNFRLQEGTNALLNGANAGGMRLSGRTLKGLEDYGQNLASSEYGNWYGRRMGENQDQWNRYATLAGYGSGANSQAVNANQNTANAISNNLMNTGNANAAASMQGYNGTMGLLNTGMMGAGLLYSDERLKDDIEESGLGLEFIKELRPVRYRYKNDAQTHDGLIAQELKQAMENAGVDGSMHADLDYQAINYVELISPLIKAVQELSAKVEELEGA